MELLIPGLILVALMIWASTKIKKSAAAAYAEETFTADRFTIEKPEGFIIPVNEDSPYVFTARTKEYETIGRESIPQATASVTIESDGFESVCRAIRSRVEKVVDEDVHLEGSRVCVINADESENNVTYLGIYKILELDDRALVLHARILPEQSEELTRKIDAMVRSFSAN
ncbi:MAG TPA: hypothetical protein VJL58_00275 [Pyrinomonadaceae bacterium]|nr:hypothetical protein [Pyrinomonadaceae bacterium]